MPELPEVETVVRMIRPDLLGRRITDLTLHTPQLVRCQSVPIGQTVGLTIFDVLRRGKFIRIELANRERPTLSVLVHLRMTGRLAVHPSAPPPDRHDHIDATLDSGATLRFRDMRKFGGWWVLRAEEAEAVPPLSELGPEPLEISRRAFTALLARRRQKIKALLLDQHRLAGLGNIYCDEALFAAGIHPETAACDVSAEGAAALWRHMRRILRAAISRQGSTIQTFYRPDGGIGGYQDRFRVYGRAGQQCVRCGTTLGRGIVAGRGTTFCPRCQPRRRGR